MLLPLQLNGLNLDAGVATASITANQFSEAQIVAGGQQIVVTLTNDTWVASGATFDAQRQNIIDGLTSAQSELLGWNNEVRDNEVVTAVVRTSDTVVTITLTAAASYSISASETITVTVPGTAVTGAVALVGTPTVIVIGATLALSPMILPASYESFLKPVSVALVSAATQAEAGIVSVQTPTSALAVELGPKILASPQRTIVPKVGNDLVNLIGAQAQAQGEELEGTAVDVLLDGAPASATAAAGTTIADNTQRQHAVRIDISTTDSKPGQAAEKQIHGTFLSRQIVMTAQSRRILIT